MRRLIAAALLAAAALSTPAAGGAQTAGAPMRLSAWAVNMSNIATGANAVMDIRVNRWSTAAERQQLITTFFEKGQDGLLRALQKASVKGRMRIPGWQGPDPHHWSLGNDLRYAWQGPLAEGGQRIVIATDRYIGMGESIGQPRTLDYPFTFIEIHLNADGRGEGKMAVATKLAFNKKKNIVELENYSSEPVRLQNVRVEKSS